MLRKELDLLFGLDRVRTVVLTYVCNRSVGDAELRDDSRENHPSPTVTSDAPYVNIVACFDAFTDPVDELVELGDLLRLWSTTIGDLEREFDDVRLWFPRIRDCWSVTRVESDIDVAPFVYWSSTRPAEHFILPESQRGMIERALRVFGVDLFLGDCHHEFLSTIFTN